MLKGKLKAKVLTPVMYKDENGRFVVTHYGHVVVRSFNLAVADKTYRSLGGR